MNIFNWLMEEILKINIISEALMKKVSIHDVVLILTICILLDIPQTDGQLQVEDIEVRGKCTYLRFIIDSGYDHFISIHKLNIAGNAVHG